MDYFKKLKYWLIEKYGCWTWNDKLKEITVGQAQDDYAEASMELSKLVKGRA